MLYFLMLLIIGALINMEIKVVYIVIHDATVDRYVLASQTKKMMCRGQVGISLVVIMTTYYAGGRLWLPGGVL